MSNGNQKHLCGRRLKTNGDQSKTEQQIFWCFQQVFNKTYMHPNQRINFNDWYMKKGPLMWIAVDFECMKVLIKSTRENGSFMKNLFVIKPIAVG